MPELTGPFAARVLIAAAFGLACGLWQVRNGVRFPVWYTALYVILFNAGVSLLMDEIL